MYIIVVGGGQLGYYLTKALLNEGHEVLTIEKTASVCEKLVNEMGSVCVRGDGCEVSTLAEAGTGRADMLIAVTGDDEDNLVSCQLAKHRFQVARTIARINNPKNEALFKKLGVDVTVSSTDIILEHIKEEVPTHPLTHLLNLPESGLEVVEVRIPPHSTSVGRTIKDLAMPDGSTLSLIIRKDHKPIVPGAATVIEEGDQVIAVTTPDSEEALRVTLRGV
jgi:trk system potassium uptake protein TrkA